MVFKANDRVIVSNPPSDCQYIKDAVGTVVDLSGSVFQEFSVVTGLIPVQFDNLFLTTPGFPFDWLTSEEIDLLK